MLLLRLCVRLSQAQTDKLVGAGLPSSMLHSQLRAPFSIMNRLGPCILHSTELKELLPWAKDSQRLQCALSLSDGSLVSLQGRSGTSGLVYGPRD